MNLARRVSEFLRDLTDFNDRWALDRHGEEYERELAEIKRRKVKLLAEIRSRDKEAGRVSQARPANDEDAMGGS